MAHGPNRNNSSGHTRPSPLHGIVNAPVIALGILLAGGVLLTASAGDVVPHPAVRGSC